MLVPDCVSSFGFAVSLWSIAPTEMMFFAHACGREFWLLVFDWLWQIGMSNWWMIQSISAERASYAVICA